MTQSLSLRASKFPRAVLFDNDGVLIVSEPLHWAAWGKLLTELGLPYAEAEIRALVGQTGPQIMAAVLNAHRPGWSAAEYDLDELAKRKNDYYLAELQTGLRPYPGVLEGLAWLRSQGVKLAVVSNAKRRELESSLNHLGIAAQVDCLISRDDVARAKPDPLPYLTAADQLGMLPEECLAVEDSPPGISAAMVGGIPAAAVLTNFPREMMIQPVPGRPDLRPVWMGPTVLEFLDWLRGLPR